MEVYEVLAKQQFEKRENEIFHPTYDVELSYYELIKNGNIEELEKKTDWEQVEATERGVLSADRIRNVKYHMIISIAMITRFCIEGGLSEQVAYNLSDIYIKWIDETNDRDTLTQIQKQASFDFARRMRKLYQIKDYSIHCKKALDYIYNHLHEKIEIEAVASYVGIDPTYLSKLFLKETGQTVGVFVRKQKIEEAKNMLVFTSESCADIAQYMAFASSSHFSKVFKEEVGMRPLQYRNHNYRRHW